MPSEVDLSRLPEVVRQVLAGLDRSRPLEEICDALAIPAAKGRQIVAKLVRIGILRPPRPAESFSEAEEAFFASEVELDPWEEVEEARPTIWAWSRALAALRLVSGGG